MNYIGISITVAVLLLLLAGILEKALHRRHLKKIPVRILVNGTRGKSTVTRLLTAMLRQAGLRTWGKSTGTQAMYLYPDGTEAAYRKPHRIVNIREQIPFVRKAAADGAQAIVVECMALHPENQRMMAEELVRPTLTVITNARVDHLAEIGRTEEETVETLSLSVPKDSALVSADARFDAYCARRVPVEKDADRDALASMFSYEMFPENIDLALTVAQQLGIDRQTAVEGLLKARPDPGMRGPFRVGECLVVNGFAANDLTSSEMLLERMRRLHGFTNEPVWLLFNSRADREFRLSAFLPLIRSLAKGGAQLRAIGDRPARTARFFAQKAGIVSEPLAGPAEEWLKSLSRERCLVFCIGNIKGDGLRLIETLSKTEGDAVCFSKP
jgi:poly-gamma-glutamate synthase PgsB/CapB